MRKALIGILMAATMATPVWAQRGERGNDPDRTERQAQRAERQAERQAQRVEREAAPAEAAPAQAAPERPQYRRSEAAQSQQPTQQSWQGRSNRGDAEVRQSGRGRDGGAVQSQQSWQGRSSDGNARVQQSWRGRGNGGDAYRRQIEASREASRDSAADGSPALQRRAAENQARYEQQLRDRRGDNRGGWDRNGRGDRSDWNRNGRGDRSDWNRNGRNDGRNWGDDRRDGRSWNRNWRNDNRYDWQHYRYSNRDIFRGGSYYAPYRNHRYSRLSIGLILGSAFFGQNYWIDDPWYYRLPPAYPGTRWVRYYDDVLLVDVYSGEVIDVIYDFFW
jgi:hypothetical protein